ncbi:hypothetical protein [Nonomuraea sp. B5E05]|uniref:hypothetical protein n=1 Tax=Nonomuraea sp. B5E05 TaxID=3153569 RepID=UPI003261CCFA
MNSNRELWMAVIVTAGVLIAIVGGGLAWLGGTPAAIAILVGATGFAGFVGLALAIATFLTRTQP